MRRWDAVLEEHKRLLFLRHLVSTGRVGDWIGTRDDDGAPWTRDPDICCRSRIEPSWRHSLAAIRTRPR